MHSQCISGIVMKNCLTSCGNPWLVQGTASLRVTQTRKNFVRTHEVPQDGSSARATADDAGTSRAHFAGGSVTQNEDCFLVSRGLVDVVSRPTSVDQE